MLLTHTQVSSEPLSLGPELPTLLSVIFSFTLAGMVPVSSKVPRDREGFTGTGCSPKK